MVEEYPNYYSIIPANVRYSKKISDGEKILYSEITALCNKNGYCWASNSYFAKLYDLAIETISRRISKLEKHNFIKTELNREEGNKRKIFLINNSTTNDSSVIRGIDSQQNRVNPANNEHDNDYSNNFQPNTTSINNKINKNNIISKSENIPHQKIKDLYNSICKSLDEIKLITGKRRDKIQTRWKELKVICEEGQAPIDLIETIFKKVEASDFLTNRRKSSNPKYQDFKVDFNWIFDNDTNYVKVLEGKYDNKDNDNRNNYDKKSAEERRQKILEAQRKRFQRDD